mgnify:FL=1
MLSIRWDFFDITFRQTLRGVPSADINLDWASKFIRTNFDGRPTCQLSIACAVCPAFLYRHNVSKFVTPLQAQPRRVRLQRRRKNPSPFLKR